MYFFIYVLMKKFSNINFKIIYKNKATSIYVVFATSIYAVVAVLTGFHF